MDHGSPPGYHQIEEKIQTIVIDNSFSDIIAENFPILRKGWMHTLKVFKKENRQEQKETFPQHVTVKIQNIQNKEHP
jgi:hypothetical protein